MRGAHPRRQRDRAPRVPARGGHRGRPGRLDRVHHHAPSTRRRPARRGRSAPSSTWSSGWRSGTRTRPIVFLDKTVCYCSTMNRIDLPHLVWALESLARGPGGQPDHRRPGRRRTTPGSPWTGCSRCPERATNGRTCSGQVVALHYARRREAAAAPERDSGRGRPGPGRRGRR